MGKEIIAFLGATATLLLMGVVLPLTSWAMSLGMAPDVFLPLVFLVLIGIFFKAA